MHVESDPGSKSVYITSRACREHVDIDQQTVGFKGWP